MQERRVVITGLGAITPLGNSVDEFWASVKAGKNGIGPITHFDASQHSTKIAAEVRGFATTKLINPKPAQLKTTIVQYASTTA